MKESIQLKLDKMKKLAQASKSSSPSCVKQTSAGAQDSLAKAIKTEKEAALFLAGLEAAFKLAQERKD